jgi:hypothetical protein
MHRRSQARRTDSRNAGDLSSGNNSSGTENLSGEDAKVGDAVNDVEDMSRNGDSSADVVLDDCRNVIGREEKNCCGRGG